MNKTEWRFYKEDGYDLRECNKCKLSQVKTKDGDWAVYFTYARIEHAFDCWINDIAEECTHTPDE